MEPTKVRVQTWKSEKGFGFVLVNGQRAFLHATDIWPEPEFHADLTGKTLIVLDIKEDQKGLRVTQAKTLERYEKDLAEKAEEARRKEVARLEEARIKKEAEDFLDREEEKFLASFKALFAEGKVKKESSDSYLIDTGDKLVRAKVPEVEAEVVSEEPLVLHADLFAEISRMASNGYTTLAKKSLGPIGSVTIEGWEALKVGSWETHPCRVVRRSRGQDEGITWGKETKVAKITFAAKVKLPIFFSKEFPISIGAPYKEKEKVIQKISCQTPCGEVSHTLQLWPEVAYSDWPTHMQVWGSYDISDLIAESSAVASEWEVRSCLMEKFKQENVPSVWDESGDNYVASGLHGGDYVSVTYTNKIFSDEVERLYGLGLRKEILAEVAMIPSEAVSLGWAFKLPYQYSNNKWPTIFYPVVVSQTDNDLTGVNRPRWVDPVQRPEYRKVLDAVLAGITAKEAVKSFLGECRQAEPVTRQQVAEWIRTCRREGARYYREWRNPPKVGPKLADRVGRIFAKLKEKQLRKEGVEAKLAQKAAENAAEEHRLIDLANVRKNWREMLGWRWKSLKALHSDAQSLLENIRTAQSRAEEIKHRRDAHLDEERRRVQWQAGKLAEKGKKVDADKFLSKDAWKGLDNLKL